VIVLGRWLFRLFRHMRVNLQQFSRQAKMESNRQQRPASNRPELSTKYRRVVHRWKRDMRDDRPDPVQGISGYGASVHEALRDRADGLAKSGVWIEVTDPNHPWRDTQFKKIE
jgi:hypothetical protein